MSANGLRSEMETAFRQSLNLEEKLHASQADVGEWNRAKNRIYFAMPKVKEFVHRATWAATVPERKRLEEVVRDHIEPRVPLADVDKVWEEMEHLLKARQVLFSQATSVQTESRSIVAETQRALSNLRRNAVNNARKTRSTTPGRRKTPSADQGGYVWIAPMLVKSFWLGESRKNRSPRSEHLSEF